METKEETRTNIKSKVRNMFKKLKFINDKSHMLYDSPFAEKVVYPEMGMADLDSQQKLDWWYTYKDFVKRSLENKRNGVVNAIKESFMGE